MRVAIAAVHYAVGMPRFLRDAFARIGVDVRSIGAAAGNKIWDREIDPRYTWNPDGHAHAVWPDWRPDLIILAHHEAYHHTGYADVPHVVYSVDNHVSNVRQPGIAHYFLAHRHSSVMPATEFDTTWLPCAYDPTLCTPSPTPWLDRKHDVCMIGMLYSHRLQLIEMLLKENISVIAGTGAVYEEFRDAYHNSRISLCASLRGDVGMRIFETAAMRSVVLSDPCPDLAQLHSAGIALFDSPEQCLTSVRYLLEHPRDAEAVIEQSSAWVAPHTWDARAKQICDWYRQRYGTPPSER